MCIQLECTKGMFDIYCTYAACPGFDVLFFLFFFQRDIEYLLFFIANKKEAEKFWVAEVREGSLC